ncbi:MAG: hypothetical protein ACOCYZ_04275 [Halococcoides sp.]
MPDETAGTSPAGGEGSRVVTHCASTDRTVFVEEDSGDAWIATDWTVSVDP